MGGPDHAAPVLSTPMAEGKDEELDIRLSGSEIDEPSDLDWPQGEDADEERPLVVEDLSDADADSHAGAGSPARLPPMLPAISGRVEIMQGAITTLSMRLDGLTASLDSLRTVLSDRLTEHMDGFSRVAQSHATDIEENRHSAERLVADLRKATAANEDTLRRVSARLEEIVTSVDAVVDLVRSAAAEPRDTAAGDKIERRLAEGLEKLGDLLVARLDEFEPASAEPGDTAAGDKIGRRLVEGLEKVGDPLLEQLEQFEPAAAELREEMMQLRRRIGLRGKGSQSIGDDQIDRIADAVAARVELLPTVIADKQLDRLVDAVVERLQSVLEVVDDEPDVAPAPPRRQRSSKSSKSS